MVSTIANPATPAMSKVLDNAAQLHRLLEEAGLSTEARQRVIDDPDFRTQLVGFWNGTPDPGTSVTAEQAAQIMGSNFHGIEALERHFGVKLSSKSKKTTFGVVPFSAEVLQQCAETHVLVACASLSLMDVWEKQRQLFYSKDDPWYRGQSFATTKVKAGWQLVRKSPLPDSVSKTWDEQQALLSQGEQVPSASVLAQALLLHYLETGVRLFEAIYGRVSDVDSDGFRVYLGLFDQDGLNVSNDWVSNRSSNIGLASSRKLN